MSEEESIGYIEVNNNGESLLFTHYLIWLCLNPVPTE